MGTSLNGLTPANTYQALIKVGNNTNLNTTLKTLSDGAGNDLPMQASTTAINFTGTVSGVASGVAGAIQFSNGSAFASDANNLFWDDTNNRLGIGTSTPSTTLQVGGSVRFGTGSVGTSLFWDNTNGRLSIGSSLTPSYPLEVNGQSFFNENIIIANGDGIKFWVDKVRIKPPTTDSLGFYTGTTSGSPSERMRIDSAGNVGIGTNAPTGKLQVTESFTTTGNNYSAITFDGTLTSRATASDTIFGFRNTQSIVATATGQTIIANDLTPNYTFFDANTNYVGLKVGGSANTQNLGTAIWCVQKTTAGNNGLAISPYNSRWAIGMTSGTTNNINGCDLIIGQGGIGVGISGSNPNARLDIKGTGSTSATTSLLVQNSSGSTALTVYDNGTVTVAGTQAFGGYQFCASGVVLAQSGFTTNDIFKGDRMVLGNTGGGTIVASAILQADSTTKGFLPPRMTTTQKNAIASPAEGLQMYDSTAKSPAYYDGTNWGYTGGALQNAAGNSGTLNISFAAGNIVNLTLNANTTLAFSNAVIGTYIIQVTQGATGANVLTYPASVKWAGGTAPTLTTTVGKTDILTFYYDGTNYYGNYSLNY